MNDINFLVWVFFGGVAFLLGLGFARAVTPRSPTVIYMPLPEPQSQDTGAGWAWMVILAIVVLAVAFLLLR
jgi:hypothetical protein